MKRFLAQITTFLSVSVVVAILVIAWVVGTATGSGWTVKQLDSLEPRLVLDYQSGSLWSGLQFNSLSWRDQNNFIQLKNIDSSWDLACLLQDTFCIKALVVDYILVRTASSEEQDDSSDTPIILSEIIFPIAIKLENLVIARLEIQSADKMFAVENIALAVEIAKDRLSVKQLSASHQSYTAELSGTLQLSGDYPLDIQSHLTVAELLGKQKQKISLKILNSLKEIEFEGALTGAVTASFNGEAKPLQASLPYSVQVGWKHLQWPLTGQPDFTMSQGSLDINGKKLDYTAILNTKVDGKNIPESVINVGLTGDAQRLSITTMEVETLGGVINIEGELSWKERLAWQSRVEFSEIDPGQYWPDYSGNLNGAAQISGAIRGQGVELLARDVLVYGKLRDYPLNITADLEKNAENHLKINHALLSVGDNRVTVAGSLTDSWNFSGDIYAPEMNILSPDVEGRLQGSLTVAGDLEKPDIKAALTGSGIRYLGNVIGTLELQADIRSLFEKQSHFELTAHEIQADSVVINKVDIKLQGSRASHRLQVVIDADQQQADIALSGALSPQYEWNGAIDNAWITSMGQRWLLVDPTALSWSSATGLFNLAPHCWQYKKAELCLLNQLTNLEDEEARVTLTGYALADFQQWLPQELMLTGVLNAYSHSVWSKGQSLSTVLNAEVHAGGIEFEDEESAETVAFQYQKLAVKASAMSEQFETDFILRSRALGDAKVNLMIDPKKVDKPIVGNAQIDGLNIEFLRSFFPRLKTLSGVVNASGNIEGTLKKPVYIGKISLNNLEIDSPDLPVNVKNGDIEFNLEGDKGRFEGAWQTGGGPAQLSGTADWSVAEWWVDMDIAGQQLEVKYPPVIDAQISPDITIQLRPGKVDINGKIAIPHGRIKLKELPENATPLSNDVVIISETGEQKKADSRWEINTYMLLELGNDVRLSGFGLRALLAGELRIIQAKSGDPDMYGEIFIVEGTYKGYGQDLKTEGGRIVFVGPLESTALEIDAVRKTDDVTAGLHIRGTIDQPDITLFSEPQQSEENTLAYIVLGRPALRSEEEGSALASAALSLGVKGGRGIATKIAKKLGIREFEVEASEQGGQSQVVFSGRLLPNLTMSYGVGVFTPESSWTLRYDLSEKFYIETVQGLESSLDIFYSFDFQRARNLFK